MCVPVSAKMRRGIDDLLESILLLADVDPQTANPKGECLGTVIESRLDKQRGPMATLLVQNGTLQRERQHRERGNLRRRFAPCMMTRASRSPRRRRRRRSRSWASPTCRWRARRSRSSPTTAPPAPWLQSGSCPRRRPQDPRPCARWKASSPRPRPARSKELNLILKADVQGSIEPIVNSLEKLSTDKLKVKILHQGTGNITESDVMLAIASHAIIVGFSVVADSGRAAPGRGRGRRHPHLQHHLQHHRGCAEGAHGPARTGLQGSRDRPCGNPGGLQGLEGRQDRGLHGARRRNHPQLVRARQARRRGGGRRQDRAH